ncbi:2-succinyl-5-enolpyruvyl-6-hydroxy-3-cyclohexene-1-carboxylic-acid synthase [bacterium]|nr:2-succinyl-5-enolpyruvyl-6-hydroxy-3-cyclohexene-1-carboxylic-acid synthase [bacterium]
MFSGSLNQIWAAAIVEELVRNGCTRFLLSPGSRNTPLLLAADAHPRTDCELLVDERAAGYKALGLGAATGRAAVLVCTSGTAVANYLPAVTEAHHAATPLIVISADRPTELRDTGANQSIDQVGIFGGRTNGFFDLPAPRPDVPLTSVLTAVDQLVYRAHRGPAGPVHLNCQFAEPLAPSDEAPDFAVDARLEAWAAAEDPFTRYAVTEAVPAPTDMARAARLLSGTARGVVVVGRLAPGDDGAPVLDLARRLRLPLLADVSSGLRFGPGNVLSHYDHFLRCESFAAAHRPNVVLHLGGPLVSSALQCWLDESGADYVRVQRTPDRLDPGHATTLRLEMDPVRFCTELPVAAVTRDSALLDPFARADAICAAVLADALPTDGLDNEEAVARRVLDAVPDGGALFLGNSMPVRDAEACGARHGRDVRVGVNRGASGIDGLLATAAGFAEGLARRTVLLVGDLALLHDLNSLHLLARNPQPVTVVLLNNDGGGIFSFLPVAGATDRFEACFGAAHGLAFGAIVESFGLDHHAPASADELDAALAASLASPRSSVIEIRTDRARNLDAHRRLQRAVERALSAESS